MTLPKLKSKLPNPYYSISQKDTPNDLTSFTETSYVAVILGTIGLLLISFLVVAIYQSMRKCRNYNVSGQQDFWARNNCPTFSASSG